MSRQYILGQSLPKAEVVLHCGDLTRFGEPHYFESALQMLSTFDAELKLVIAGNHDLDLDGDSRAKSCDEHGDDSAQHEVVLNLMRGPLADKAGVTYLEEGTSTFTLKDGKNFTVYSSPYTPNYGNLAFPYERDEDRFNSSQHTRTENKSIATNPIPKDVDIVMTHGPPKGVLDFSSHGGELGCENLLHAVQRVRPLMHCFGHIHEGHGAKIVNWENKSKPATGGYDILNKYPTAIQCFPKRGTETLMLNAAIMTEENQPINAPWLIDLPICHAN